jgi:dipeptidyl aminopeptidase/acylaminoacyl peptidase
MAASEREGESAVGLWLVEVESGLLERVGGPDFEIEDLGLEWHPQGDRLAVVASAQGLPRLAIIAMPSREVRVVRRGLRAIQALGQCRGRLAFIAASMRNPEEVYSVDWDCSQERRHSRLNRMWSARRPRPRVAKRRFAVPDGNGGTEKVEAWLLRPTHGEGPFPLLVDMHGGPHSTVRVDFAAHVYWYLLLSQGWAILAPNAVGSTSYGQAFAERLRGRWGELDLPQYEAIIGALQDQGLADDRIACAGKSYGGFLSAWAIGHSDLFKAAAVAAPVANIESHAGTSDTGYYVTPFAMDGGIIEARERYHRLSPVEYCHRVTAATLILQGENDGRCPRGQSEELFSNLIRCSAAPVELVVYPSSSHAEAESGRPSNRIDYHARLVRWLGEHVTSRTDTRDRDSANDHTGNRSEPTCASN